jgi:hypothetical protein
MKRMVCDMTPTTREYHLNIHAAGKTYCLDYQQSFRFGYTLVRTRKFKEAVQVFEAMRHSNVSSSSAAIVLAYCKACLREFKASNDLLDETFAENEKDKAEQLQTAFVYISVGMWTDALEELTKLVNRCHNLPEICLLLGDLFASRGKPTKAILCWQHAAKRDHHNGVVAAIARQSLSAQKQSHRSL